MKEKENTVLFEERAEFLLKFFSEERILKNL